jgi:photosystem II stability/assembly factor-like uncharacterized protein
MEQERLEKRMIWRLVRRFGVAVVLWGMFSAAVLHAMTWFPMGPYGGHARSFAADPSDSQHLYLGTATGWLYESHNGGDSWARVSQIGKSDDLVLDHILIDPANSKHIIVGVFRIDHPDGGVFISDDAGKSWYEQAEMRGQSVRSMARSLSNPQEIVAGTLGGVYRSLDGGLHWALISPEGSTEIHEVESLAIDPVNPQIIYAGTWHLPWKTIDGGEHWKNIKDGIIEDSDVFSIIIDPVNPKIVFASACSGIYKSTNAGELFSGGVTKNRLQGILGTAYRTRKLMQDPSNLNTVYAGTTQGLYKTIDGGETYVPMTGTNVIVNDVYVDPKNSNHVLLATERDGVLSSLDGGVAFQPANNGFSARQVSAYAQDAHSNATIYVGVVNDKATGGVFESIDGGLRWQQESDGLDGRDVFSLVSTPIGTLLAGTAHGIFRLSSDVWLPSGTSITAPVRAAQPSVKAVSRSNAHARTVVKAKVEAPVATAKGSLDAIIYSLVADGDFVYAGTSQGLLRAADDGNSWAPVSTLKMPETHFVAAHDSMVMAAGLRRIALSMDGGTKWDAVPLPPDLTQISSIAIDGLKNLWVGGTEGVYYSTDYGLTWKTMQNLFLTEVNSIFYDAVANQVLVTSSNQKFAFGVHLPDYKVNFWDTGWKLRFVRPVGDHLIGATLFDGMVLQPRMVATEMPK